MCVKKTGEKVHHGEEIVCEDHKCDICYCSCTHVNPKPEGGEPSVECKIETIMRRCPRATSIMESKSKCRGCKSKEHFWLPDERRSKRAEREKSEKICKQVGEEKVKACRQKGEEKEKNCRHRKQEKEKKCIQNIAKGKTCRQKTAKWEKLCSQRSMKYAEKVCRQAREERERKCLQRVAERVKMCKEKGEENKKACKRKGEKKEKLCRQKDNARQQEEDANEIEPMGQ